MFIELLVVAVVISFLYTSGFVEFDSGYGIALSLVIVIGAGCISFVMTHFVARQMVDRLFGFGSWSPRGDTKQKSALTPDETKQLASMPEGELRLLLKKNAADVDLSRRVSEIFLQRGRTDLFVAERLRLVETGTLTREQVCAIFNRIADVKEREGNRGEAIQYLQQVAIRYPGTVEAENAGRRCELLEMGDCEQIVSRSRA